MRLDVYNDPWISLETTDGRLSKTGVRDCLGQAQFINKVWVDGCVTYMDNITPLILMTMILARVFRPDRDTKLDMYEAGEFDIQKIDDYIDSCVLKGISFDIFDSKKPFLQCSDELLNEISKGKPGSLRVPLGSIEPFYLSGNNLLFYNTRDIEGSPKAENGYAMTPGQYTASLIRNHMYRAASGSGHVSTGVGSQPPLNIIVNGSNLFETLLFMLPEDIKEDDIPMWERRSYAPDITEYIASGNFGFLGAALWPTEYLHYGDTEDGLVKNVCMAPVYKGMDNDEKPAAFKETFIKNQPCCLKRIIKGEKDRPDVLASVILHPDTSPWMEMASSDSGNFADLPASDFIRELAEDDLIDKNRIFGCTIYGLNLSTSSDPFKDPAQMISSFDIPEGLLAKEAGLIMKKLAGKIRSYAYDITKCLSDYDRSVSAGREDSSIGTDGAITDVQRKYLELSSDKAEKKWTGMIAEKPDEDTLITILEETRTDVMKAYDSYIPVRDDFIQRTLHRNELYGMIRKEPEDD